MMVKGSAYATLRCGVCSFHRPGAAARIEKYIANRPAKNISSLESHTIVPTLTMLGLVSEWIRLWSIVVEAAVTRSLLPPSRIAGRRGGDLSPRRAVIQGFCVDSRVRPGVPGDRATCTGSRPSAGPTGVAAYPAVVFYAHGEENLPPFTLSTAFTDWNVVSLLTLGLLVSAGLYLYGVWKLRSAGHAWPVSRTIFFVPLGLGLIAFVTLGGIGAYDDQTLSIHMVQHMVLGMIAPIFLALGAPVTLALRTLPRKPRGARVSALHSRIAKVLAFPLFSFALFVATPFALYFSGLYQLTLEHEWLHNLTHLHFIVVG